MGFITWIADKFGTKTALPAPARRSYSAAAVSRLTASWTTTNKSADADLRGGLKVLRARARDLERNNDYARRFLDMCIDGIVGDKGVRLQNKALNANGSLDKSANDKVEAAWADWGRLGVCEVTGLFDWVMVQALAVRTWKRDGECLVRMRKDARNRHRFALQFIDVDQLDERYNDQLANGNQIRMGVEVDSDGKPVAYHLLKFHPSDIMAATSQERIRVPASEIIHLFMAERHGQTRGIPRMACGMTTINNVGGYVEAAIINARTGASKMGFFTRTNDAGLMESDEKDDKGNFITDADPGSFDVLPIGYDLKTFDPAYPSNEFDAFMQRNLKGVASGWGVDYHRLASDYTDASWSSVRQSAADERDNWKFDQQVFIARFVRPIFEAWLSMALLTQALRLPVDKYEKLNSPRWQPRRWSWVDPAKEEQARTEAYQQRRSSLTRLLAEQGEDIEDLFDELEAEQKLAQAKGITLPPLAGSAKEVPPNGTEDTQP